MSTILWGVINPDEVLIENRLNQVWMDQNEAENLLNREHDEDVHECYMILKSEWSELNMDQDSLFNCLAGGLLTDEILEKSYTIQLTGCKNVSTSLEYTDIEGLLPHKEAEFLAMYLKCEEGMAQSLHDFAKEDFHPVNDYNKVVDLVKRLAVRLHLKFELSC